MLTFYDCQTDRGIITAANVSPDSADFASKLNEAGRRLMDYGDWWATVIKTRVACYSNTITWPRWVGTVLALNAWHDNHPLRLLNGWYDFVPLDANDWRHIALCYPSNRTFHHHHHGGASVNDMGTACVFQNVPVDMTNYVIAYPRCPFDAGKTLTIWGTDLNGQPCSEVLTMPDPSLTKYRASVNQYIRIDRVLKDASYDFFDVYQCADAVPNTTTAPLLEMAHYEPGETHPEYRITRVHGFHHHHTGYPHLFTALVKLQHIDAVAGNDPVLPPNRAALKLMILSINKEDSSDPQGAELEAQRAVHELNRELNNKLPEFQTPISYQEFGGVDMRRHSAF